MLAIRLPQEIEHRLADLSKKTGRTKTFYAREAILRHIEDLEDIYITEQRLLDLKSGKSSTVTLEELLKEYDLEN